MSVVQNASEQTMLMRSSTTPGYPVHQQVVDALTAIANNGHARNSVRHKLELRAALHAILGAWVELMGSKKSERLTKKSYQQAAFSAVDREESGDDDFHLEDLLVTLNNSLSAASAQLEDPNLPEDSEQKALLIKIEDTTSRQIKELKAQISKRHLDIAFLTARALDDILETAQWGMSPVESSSDLTMTALYQGLKSIATAIDAKHAKSNTGGAQSRVSVAGGEDEGNDSASSQDKRKGVKRPDYTEDEDLELLNIHYFNQAATLAQRVAMHNECMAAKHPGWRDRTLQAIQKRFSGFRSNGTI